MMDWKAAFERELKAKQDLEAIVSRFARKIDDNQVAVLDALRAAGVWTVSIANAGNGIPDLLCHARGRYVLLEVKDGSKVPSQQRLTPAQLSFHRNCPGELYVVRSPEEALLKVLGQLPPTRRTG